MTHQGNGVRRGFPRMRKESTYSFRASHNLRGVTVHPEAERGQHSHTWNVTLIFEHEFNCALGFWRDEVEIDSKWGRRLLELDDCNLSERMALPATAENLALWLLYCWLVPLTPDERNYELSGVRIWKSQDGGIGLHSCEVMRSTNTQRGWQTFGGEVA